MEKDPSLRSGSQAALNMVSAIPPQPLMATASTSQDDMMGTLIQTIRQEIQKALPQTNQNSSHSRSSITDGRFNSPGPNRQSANTKQKQKTEIQTTIATDTTITIKTKDMLTVAISKTTDKRTIAIHQTSNKTEIKQTNNHVGIVTEQNISPEIVKHVLTAEDWDICLANAGHHYRIKTIGNKFRMLTKTREITIKTATQIPPSNKIL